MAIGCLNYKNICVFATYSKKTSIVLQKTDRKRLVFKQNYSKVNNCLSKAEIVYFKLMQI